MIRSHFNRHGFFEGEGVVSADGSAFDLTQIPPFLRTLLVADGTVTKALEAYFWESVQVQTTVQRECTMSPQHSPHWLPLAQTEPLIERAVELRGERSGKLYATASSVLRTASLSADLRAQLLAGQLGIGELLRMSACETYRELLDFGHCRERDATIYRTYLIHLSGVPAILITEYFPLASYV